MVFVLVVIVVAVQTFRHIAQVFSRNVISSYAIISCAVIVPLSESTPASCNAQCTYTISQSLYGLCGGITVVQQIGCVKLSLGEGVKGVDFYWSYAIKYAICTRNAHLCL